MPKKPRFIHPVRHVRTCLGYTQAAFAKLLGRSTITIQRVENGRLPLSQKLADIIMETTGANPTALLKGQALDLDGEQFTKESSGRYKAMVSFVDTKNHHRNLLCSWIELLLIASERAGQNKSNSVVVTITEFLRKLAIDFNLEKNIYGFLVERGAVRKRAYRVQNLRKFPDYARIIGFKDSRRYKPDKIVKFEIPQGWIPSFDLLNEKPILPKELEKKHKNKLYLIDGDRPIPKEVQDMFNQALYWKIKQFHLHHGD